MACLYGPNRRPQSDRGASLVARATAPQRHTSSGKSATPALCAHTVLSLRPHMAAREAPAPSSCVSTYACQLMVGCSGVCQQSDCCRRVLALCAVVMRGSSIRMEFWLEARTDSQTVMPHLIKITVPRVFNTRMRVALPPSALRGHAHSGADESFLSTCLFGLRNPC